MDVRSSAPQPVLEAAIRAPGTVLRAEIPKRGVLIVRFLVRQTVTNKDATERRENVLHALIPGNIGILLMDVDRLARKAVTHAAVISQLVSVWAVSTERCGVIHASLLATSTRRRSAKKVVILARELVWTSSLLH